MSPRTNDEPAMHDPNDPSAADHDETHVERDEPARAGDDEEIEPIEIPFDRLSEGAQRGVMEEFVTREGTDYGHTEVSLDDKVLAVRRQIERREVVLLFDPKTERVNLVTSRSLRMARAASSSVRGE